MEKEGKKGGFTLIILIMLASLVVAGLWTKVPAIKKFIDLILNPTAGALLKWNLSWGMVILVFILTLFVTLIQKYATDQEALKELKKEQKEIQKQMKVYKEHPDKIMEFQKRQMKLIPEQFKLSMRALAFTSIPLILFFRWFYDFFDSLGHVKFFGITGSWFLFYLVVSLIFSSILRKYLKVV